LAAATVLAAAALLVPTLASGHIERASYWPDPGVDTAGGQPTGGGVPATRSLFTALQPAPPGDTRVVCQGKVPKYPKKKIKKARKQLQGEARKKKIKKLKKGYKKKVNKNASIKALDAAVAKARAQGIEIRPSEPRESFSRAQAKSFRKFNRRLLRNCRYGEIQPAVTASGNNDRVVIMPGIYTEPTSRSKPTNDPACDGLEEQNDRGQTGANSYRYVATCPNDQNLIAVIGRQPGGTPPQPPLSDRHGIPDNGACLRCNMQLEGSGPGPDDVIVDGGRVASGNGSPVDPAKDVGIRADRADGFVLRNMTVRHVAEHGIYPHEVDGYRLERFKTFQTEEYGVLSFAADHGLIQDCATTTSGDAGIYPGSAPDTGEQTVEGAPRYNTEIRHCDSYHNAAGYSGTAANAVWVHHNDFYDNALGFTTDVFTAAGHPGFPQDSDLVENNEFYSNNFNPYVDQPDNNEVIPTIPVPVGTGLWIAGGNNNILRNNHFWDNWRRGVMLFAVPDVFVCPPGSDDLVEGCDPTQVNTSYRNRFHNNTMSRSPAGVPDRNGTDFWWDQFPANTENCWYDNVGSAGTRASLTATPPLSPVAGVSLPGFLPEDCATSIGTTGAPQETELLGCLAAFEQGVNVNCTWFTTPSEP
jgi:Right handed beta helix region